MRRVFLAWILAAISGSGFAFESDTRFKDLDGNEIELGKFIDQGKWTLVMLWLSDCEVCAIEAPQFSEFHHANDVDTQVLGIALDGYKNKRAITDFIDRHNADFPHLIGEFPIVAIDYEDRMGETLLGTPTFVLYTPDGEIAGNMPGILRIEALKEFITGKSE